MGILDRLEKITQGVIDVATAPLALPYDLIRSFPDPNYSAGDAFSTDLNRFLGGLSDVGEGTGLTSLGRTVAQKTPLDEILGRTFTELDLYYSSGLQQEMGRLPLGLGTASGLVSSIPGVEWNPNPGDISIQRGLGTIGGAAAAALPGGTPMWEGTVRAWREANQMSPGQIIANNYFSLWNLSPEDYYQATNTLGYNLMSGGFDAAFRWWGQPEVLAGKGIKGLRNRWNPSTNRLLDRFRASTGLEATPARPMINPVASLSDDIQPMVRAGAGSHISRIWGNDIPPDLQVSLTRALTSDLMDNAKLVDGHLDFGLKDPAGTLDPLGYATERFKNLKAELRGASDSVSERVWNDVFGGDEILNDIANQISGELDHLIPEPNYGGAVNLMLDEGQGHTVLHVTYADNLESMKREGILKVPPGSDKILEADEAYQAVRSQLDELPSNIQDLSPEDLDTAFDNLLNRIAALADEGDEQAVRSWHALNQLNAAADGTGFQRPLTMQGIKDALWGISHADSDSLKSALRYWIERDLDWAAGMDKSGLPTGVSSTAGRRASEQAIYLLDEADMGEAMRYAAALKKAQPHRNPVILKINADGLPVIYEDYLNPMIPDPRSGMPSDASLMTTVDRIGPDKITDVIRPTDAELNPAAMANVLGVPEPTYLEPGGRVHEGLYHPDGSPIPPEEMIPYEEIRSTFETAAHLYSTEGESAAIRFLKDAQASRARATNATDPISMVMDHKMTQRTLNWMDGKSADEIRRVLFSDNPTGAVMSDLLANAKTYEERRLIYQAFLGLDSPELHTIAPMAEARIKALRKDLDELKRGREYANSMKDVRHATIEGSDFSNQVWMSDEEYDAMEAIIRGEIQETQDMARVGRFLESAQQQAPLDRPLRVRPGAVARERLRSSSWYQDSILSRPIRSVVEKRPHQFINVHDPNADVQVVRQLEEARPLGITSDRVRYYREAYMGATDETTRIRLLTQMDNEIIEAAAKKAGMSKAEITHLIDRAQSGRARTADFLTGRRYSNSDADLFTFYDADTGEMIQMSMPLLGTQLQNWVPITDVRAVIAQSTAIRRVRRRLGSVPKEMMDSFYHLWKPSVLLRGGWPIRVVSDEQLRILARTGSLLQHMAAIEVGEIPKFTQALDKGMSPAARLAAGVGTVTTAPLSGMTRINRWVVRGAKKLKLIDPQWYDDMASIGYEELASSRAAFSGPNEATNEAYQALIGYHEAGFLDHLYSKGTGQWTVYDKTSREYGAAWLRVLKDQIGRDPLARKVLEVMANAPDYATSRKEALNRAISTWIDETGLVGFGKVDNLAEYIADAYDSGILTQGASPRTWLDDVLRPYADYHRLDIDDIIEEVADEWATKMDDWSNGIYDSSAIHAGGHMGMRNTIEEGILSLDGIDFIDEDLLDDIVRAYDYFRFGRNPQSRGWDDLGADDFEEWLGSYLGGHSDEDYAYKLMEMTERIDDWLPEDPRVSYELQDPTSELRRWLTSTPEGREYGKKLPWNYQNVPRWVDGVVGMLSDYTDNFNGGLVDDILNDKVTGRTLEAIPDHRRPATVHGEVVAQFLGNSAITRFINDFTSTSFDVFGRLPTDTLSRQPFFKHMYANEMKRIRDTMVRQGIEMTEEGVQAASQRARAYALHEVNKWLYNLAETSRFGEMMRFMTPFYSAWQEVLEVWMGLARKDPSVIGRGRLLWQAPNKADLVTKDDEGNEFITFRLSEKMADYLPQTDWLQYLVQGGVRFDKTSFNLILNSPLPGVGPPIQVAANELVRNKPSLESTLKFLLPYGVKSNSLEILMSPVIRRLNSNIAGVDGDRSYERDFMNIMVWMDWEYRTGQRTDPPTYQEVEDAAKKIFAIRSFSTISMPAQPIIDTPLKMYQDVYRQLIEDYGPDQADEIFLNEYGSEFFAITLSRTVSESGLPPTLEAWEASQRVESLISKYPQYGRLIIGEDAAMGEFSSAVFAYQLTHPVEDSPYADPDRQYRELTLDPETGTIEEVDRRLGWTEYIEAMDMLDLERRSRGLPNLRVKEAEDLAAIKKVITKNLASKYPAWWRAFNERDDLKWDETIKALTSIAFDPLMEDRPDLAGVVDYMDARQAILAELNRRKQLGGSSTLTASSNQDLAMAWDSIVNSILEDNVAFGPIYYRYLEGDPVTLKVTTP